MKNKFIKLSFLVMVLFLSACVNKKKETLPLNGVEYPAQFVRSGYYFDKASFSETTLTDMMSKIELIDKPESLGEVEFPDFSKIELVNNQKLEITDAMIEAEIEKERDKEVTFTPIIVKREAMMTDKVTIDFDGYMDGVKFEGGSMTDYELILGSGAFIPGFEEKVVGHGVGKKFSINVTFPEDYFQAPELMGKDATFEITIKLIEEAHTPDFDNDFVVSHTTKGSTNVDEYREEIRGRIEERDEFMNNQNLTYQLYEKLLSDSKFYPTEDALAWQFSVVIYQIKQQAQAYGMEFEDMLLSGGGSVKDAFDEIKSSMPDYIEQQMVIDALYKKYKVNMDEDEVKEWFYNMSRLMGYGNAIEYDVYKEYMGYDYIYDSAKQHRVMTIASKECKIVDEVNEE